MIVLRRTSLAAYRTWWRWLPLTLPMSRAMIPVLIVLTPVMIRVGAMAALVMAMLNIVALSWGSWAQWKRTRATKGWHPWMP